METLKKYWKIAVAILLLAVGFFVGRQTSEVKTTTKLVPGKTVTDTLYSQQLSPYHSEIPDNPALPAKPDTVYLPGDSVPYAVILKTDTAKIIQNYITKNSYRKQLFDDDNGKLIVSADVQYNLLQKLSYNFTPMQKVTTIEKKRVFTPFIVGSYSTNKWIGAGIGAYYYDIGVSAQYQTNFTSKNYLFSLYYKLK
jgi:hypothetical protein